MRSNLYLTFSEGGAVMNNKYTCMHDHHGYFVGVWMLGKIKRLSLEYFADESSCVRAIQSRRWTRRSNYQAC